MTKLNSKSVRRSKLAFSYHAALAAGDIDVVAAILRYAEEDPELEKLILEVNDARLVELQSARQINPSIFTQEDNEMTTSVMRPLRGAIAQPHQGWLVASVAAVFTLILTAFIILNALNSSNIFVLFTDEEKNTAVFERYIEEAWNTGDITMLEEILAEDYIRHDPLFDNDLLGIVGEQEAIMLLRNAAPDLHITIDDLIAQGDVIWAQLTISGTQEGAIELDIIPVIPGLGNTFTFTTHNMVRFDDEKMVEMWVELDPQGFVEQLGVTPHLLTVEHNDDWTPIIREFNGVEMVLVPAGRFMMGRPKEEIETTIEACVEAGVSQSQCQIWADMEFGKHEVFIENPFWIDRYLVSNMQFNEKGGEAQREGSWTTDHLPRETINWEEAKNFCELRGTRLLTEAEWEYATSGPDNLLFPWGNEFDGIRLNWCDKNCPEGYRDMEHDDGYRNTSPVGAYGPDGDSWVGTTDMLGNVWEWTSSLYWEYPYNPMDGREDLTDTSKARVLRGASFGNGEMDFVVSGRWSKLGTGRANFVGFRCARDFDGVLDMQELPGTVLPPEMTTNEDVYMQYINEAWNNDNLDTLVYLLADDYIRHDPLFDDEQTAIALFRNAMPDMELTIDTLMSTHDTVWAQITLTGTHTGLFAVDTTMIPASGNDITINMTHVVKFDGKRMTETRVQLNTLDLMEQLGVDVVLQAVAHNDDWTPIIEVFDGVEMALVPAGVYMMGATEEEKERSYQYCVEETDNSEAVCQRWVEFAGPIHEIFISQPFWIDRYEVTNEQFDRLGGEASSDGKVQDPNHPRETVRWEETLEFCELRGGRLPTEPEWEYAASGPDNLTFPWGNEFDRTMLNYCDENCKGVIWRDPDYNDGYRYSAPVGTYSPAGDSWVGAADMAGNVWERMSTIFDQEQFPYPYDPDDGREVITATGVFHVARGGSLYNPWNEVTTFTRNRFTVASHYSIGFRCVRDYDGE